MSTLRIFRCAALLFLFSFPGRSPQAEELPSAGTFRGIYHENVAGVGKFSFYYVSPELKRQFGAYEGKYIEVEVLEAQQPMNPGDAVVKRVGKIKELPAPPIAVEIKTRFPGSGGEKTFDAVYRFKNTSTRILSLDANYVSIGLSCFTQVERPNEVDAFMGLGYTNRQRRFGGHADQVWNFIHPMEPGERTHFYSREIQLQPDESVSFVWHSIPNEGGKCEVVATALFFDRDQVPIEGWRALELPLTKGDLEKPAGLTVDANVERNGDWVTVRGRLRSVGKEPRYVFVRNDPKTPREMSPSIVRKTESQPENVFLPALVQLYSKNKELSSELGWHDQDGPWIRKVVDEKGVPFQFHIRKKDMFSEETEDRIELWLATDAGLEKFTVAKDLPKSNIPDAAKWGETVDGCRTQIRLAKNRFKSGEPIQFCWQADADDRSGALILWTERFGDAQILIDGKPAKLALEALLPEKCILSFPYRSEIELAPSKLAPGKHTLEVRVTGPGGMQELSKGVKVRRVKGTLVSKAEFEVE